MMSESLKTFTRGSKSEMQEDRCDVGEYTYEVTSMQKEFEDGEIYTVYGLTMRQQSSSGTIENEFRVADISSRKEVVLRLTEIMKRNSVTPISAGDIIDDFLVDCL